MVTKREREDYRNEIKIAENVIEEQENKIWQKTKNFYKGDHYPNIENSEEFDKMAVNLIFSNVVSQLPSLTFTAPEYEVNPPVSEAMLDVSEARNKELRAKIMQSLLNKERQKNEFRKHFQLATLDSLLSMGMLKVYHKNIKAPNPKAGETVIDFDTNQPRMKDGEPMEEPERITVGTEFKVHRVRPENFLIDPRAGNFLESANWMAEKIFMPTSEARKRFNDKDIPSVKQIDKDIKGNDLNYNSPVRGMSDNHESLNMSVIYEIWDTKEKRKFYMARNVQDKVYKESKIPEAYTEFNDNCPYVPMKHHEIPDQFYPLPDIHPQVQLNQSYNKARNDVNDYRDMFKQKFLMQSGKLDPEEEEKLSSGNLGEIIRMQQNPNTNPPIAQVPQPKNVPSQIVRSMQLDKQDLQEVSGVTELQRGGQATQGQQATQSILANESSQAKMNWKLMHVTNTANKVGNKVLELMKKKKKVGGVLKIKGAEDMAQDTRRDVRQNFIRFTPEDLSGDFEVEAVWGSSRPQNKEGEKQEFMEAMRLISSFPQILQHMDSREIAKEFTKHFPFSERVMSEGKNTEEAFRNQGGGAGNRPDDQGEAGETNSRTTPNPRTSQQGVQDVQDQIRGGLG